MSMDMFTLSWFFIFILVIFIAFVGNMIIILAILQDKSMYSSTYFYIINVNIADIILVLSCLPERIADIIYSNGGFHLGMYTCYLLPFLQQVSMHAALAFLLILTIHRCYPAGVPRCLQGDFIRKQIRKYFQILCFIWIFAILINMPLFFLTKYELIDLNDELNRTKVISIIICETEAREIWSRMYLILLLVLTYLITGIFLVIIYGQVIRIIIHSKKYTNQRHHVNKYNFLSRNLTGQEKCHPTGTSSSNSSNKFSKRHLIISPINSIKSSRNNFHSSQHLQVIIMLFIVILLYIILLLPYRLLNLLFIVSNELFQNGFINEILFQWLLNIVRLLVFLNCALQPMIYMIISSRLRQAVMKFCQSKTCCRCQCSILIDEQQQQHQAIQAYIVQEHQQPNRLVNQTNRINLRNDFHQPTQRQLIDYYPLTPMHTYRKPTKIPYTVTFKNVLRP